MNLQPSTRRVVEEWIGRIASVDRVLVAFFHAGGKSSIVSATRAAEGTKSFSDKAIPLHCINNRRCHNTVGLLVPKKQLIRCKLNLSAKLLKGGQSGGR
jgi:hypothetical protein